MMDITKSQSDFEAWWNALEQAELRDSCAMGWGFRIWKASRESIVVALPKHCERYNWSDGVFNFKQDIAEALRTAGIRIKGESE